MTSARAPESIFGQFLIPAVVVAPPADAAVAGSVGVRGDLSNRLFAQKLFSIPITPTKHQPAHMGRRTGRVVAAAPGANQWQTIDRKRLPIADGPFAVGHPDRPHDAIAQQRADICLRRVLQRCGEAVAEHGHAGIAVVKL